MFVPKAYRCEDPAIIADIIKDYGFATLVSTDEAGVPIATHLPLMLYQEENRMFLKGHIARANPQWEAMEAGRQVLAIFQGPHTYISSSWYEKENAPTWNYVAVHVYGTLKPVDATKTLDSLSELVDKYEVDSEKPVKVDLLPKQMIDSYMPHLAGFEIDISDIQAAFKLSQNHHSKDIHNIVDNLVKRNEPQAHEVAEMMQKHHLKKESTN